MQIKNIFAITLLFIAKFTASSSSSSYGQPNFQNQMNRGHLFQQHAQQYPPRYGYDQANLGHQFNLQPRFNPQQQNHQFHPSMHHNGAGNSLIPQCIGETFLVSNVPIDSRISNASSSSSGINLPFGARLPSIPESSHDLSTTKQYASKAGMLGTYIPGSVLKSTIKGKTKSVDIPEQDDSSTNDQSLDNNGEGRLILPGQQPHIPGALPTNQDTDSTPEPIINQQTNNRINLSKDIKKELKARDWLKYSTEFRENFLDTSRRIKDRSLLEKQLEKINYTISKEGHDELLETFCGFRLDKLAQVFEGSLTFPKLNKYLFERNLTFPELNKSFKSQFTAASFLEEMIINIASDNSYKPQTTNEPTIDQFLESMILIVRQICNRSLKELSEIIEDHNKTERNTRISEQWTDLIRYYRNENIQISIK